MATKILTLNLGTTSSRLAVFEAGVCRAEQSLYHSEEENAKHTQDEHVGIRKAMIVEWLHGEGLELAGIDAIALRAGGLPKAVAGGTFLVNEALREDLYRKYTAGKPLLHGNQIVMPIADALAAECGAPLYVAEPANQNNMIPEARVSGFPGIERSPIFHALNEKNVARHQAAKLGKAYEDCNFITAHMGGGVSVSCHQKGRVTDTNDCLGSEGAFSATRVGGLPSMRVVDMCFSGKYTQEDIRRLFMERGGVVAYLGVSDMREVEKRMLAGDEKAALIWNSLAYRTAKEIGALCAVVEGGIDGIILTGGMVHSQRMANRIKAFVGKFAEVSVYPGEKESEALAESVYRVLSGAEKCGEY
jgi:butyrate kinase